MSQKITINPRVGSQQRVVLLLNKIEGPPATFSLNVTSREDNTIPLPSDVVLPDGDYLVRVKVDGFESPLLQDPKTGAFIGPRISIKPGPPVINELISTNIDLTASAGDPVTITGKVTIKDQNGSPVEGARVAVTWTSLDTQPPDQGTDEQNTQNDGMATFTRTMARPNRKVTYKLSMNTISKTGYNFDPNQSPAREKSIDILPVPTPGNKLISRDIKLYGKANEQENITAVGALIFVTDENNAGVTEAGVEVELTFNADPPRKLTQLSHLDDSIAWFDNLGTHAGEYKLKVVKIEKGGSTFDPSTGMTESQHTFPSNIIYPRLNPLWLETIGGAVHIIGEVPVDTQDGRIVRGAYVVTRLEILRTNDEWHVVEFRKELTGTNGVATFRIRPAAAGAYRLCVSSMFSDGHTIIPSRTQMCSDPINFPG